MSEWKIFHLDELADIRVSNVDKKSQPGEGGVRLCNYMDVYSNDYITRDLVFMEATASAAESEKFKVEQGDVMITKDSETPDDIGIPSVVLDDIDNLVCGYHLALIKPKKNAVNPIYLSKQLASAGVSSYFSRMAAGSTRYGLSNGAIGRTRIPLPPLFKQNKIAVVLQIVDTAIEKTEALIEKYQQIKAGLMHDLFTRGIGADGKLRPPREQAPELYQQTPIGWIPKGWEVKSLKDLYKNPIRDFGSFSSTNLITFLDEGVPFIKSEMIKEEEIDWSTVSFISIAVHGLLSKSHVQEGQILFSKIGSALGKAVLYGGERGVCNSNAAVAKIEVDEGIVSPQFIEMFLNSEFARKQFRLMIISLLPRINLGDINKLLVQTPKIDEQLQICACYSRLKVQLKAEKNLLAKLKQQKSGLMHDLLTGKIRVKLDEQLPEMTGG